MTTTYTDADLLAELISYNSSSQNSNIEIANFVSEYLEDGGIEVIRNFNRDKSKVNLIARITGTQEGDKGQGLILSGHLDVVPATESDWVSDPFTMRETSLAYFGRGTCDMKGFVALAINTLRQAVKRSLRYPLVIILTFDEELGLLGAQHLATTWSNPYPWPRAAIVGEPTSLRVVRAHKGCMYINIQIHGQGAHSAYPHLGNNAIVPAARIITELDGLAQKWSSQKVKLSDLFPASPHLTLAVTKIEGGSANNIIPEHCQITLGLRPLPGQDRDTLLAEIKAATTRGLAGAPNIVSELEVIANCPPMLVKSDAPICHMMCDLMTQEKAEGVSYATDAAVLGTMGIDPIIWGPGSIDVAHKPNEFIPKHEFTRARQVLNDLVERVCYA